MDKFIYNEINGLWYELQGDYYLPCLKLPEEEWRISAYGDSGLSFLSLNTSKKAERTKEIIGACLDCFVEKGLMQLAKMKG